MGPVRGSVVLVARVGLVGLAGLVLEVASVPGAWEAPEGEEGSREVRHPSALEEADRKHSATLAEASRKIAELQKQLADSPTGQQVLKPQPQPRWLVHEEKIVYSRANQQSPR